MRSPRPPRPATAQLPPRGPRPTGAPRPACRPQVGRQMAGPGQGRERPGAHSSLPPLHPSKGNVRTHKGGHTHTHPCVHACSVVSAGSRLHTHIQGEKEGESRGPAPKVGRALVPLPAQASPCLVWLLTGSLERAAQGGAGNAGGASFLRGLCLCLCACVKLTGENLSVEAVAWRLEGQQGPLSLARSPAHPSSWLR